tara:strand:- start:1173 stop:1589 length:417 start_codon:yes stop_codon:yes gene_type:complete
MFFKKKNNEKNNEYLVKVTALLIHAAKIDENYSTIEEKIIKQTLIEIGVENENVDELIKNAKKLEENNNQILEFTREVKNMDETKKIKIVETLWRIIYSNNDADIFETNLMRRLEGLLYIDRKIMGNLKDKIKKENEK